MAVVSEKAAAPTNSIFYSFSRKMPNDTYLNVPLDVVFQPGDIIRLTVFSRIEGPISITQSDAVNPAPKRIFPAASSGDVQVRPMEHYPVPVDITVTPGEHLHVSVGPNSIEIPVPMSQK
jgi:hypothetical protein